MSNFTKLHLSHEIYRYLPVFSQFLWNLTFIFSDSLEKFSLMMTIITSLGLKKCKKNAIFFKLLWYKVFVHWGLKLLNFLGNSLLISFFLKKKEIKFFKAKMNIIFVKQKRRGHILPDSFCADSKTINEGRGLSFHIRTVISVRFL